jgi:hypothetical protein
MTELDYQLRFIEEQIKVMSSIIHADNQHWWIDIDTGEHKERNVGEMLMLCVSELAEAMEGHRKDLMDTHLPQEKMFDVELADVFIRLLDIAVGTKVDLGKMVRLKLVYNRTRPDHTMEARRMENGKKY